MHCVCAVLCVCGISLSVNWKQCISMQIDKDLLELGYRHYSGINNKYILNKYHILMYHPV